MKRAKLIAPSILSADFARLGEEVRAVEKAGADWVHVDVMDGRFVPNLTIGPLVVEALRKVTRLPLDVHLMIEDPNGLIEAFVSAGADSLTIHQEAAKDPARTLRRIRDLGTRPGVSIKPATPVDAIAALLAEVDLVLVMTVNPGFGGQKLIPECVAKIRQLEELRASRKLGFQIEADGGIGESTVAAVSRAGCDVFVAGSAVFKSTDYALAIRKLREKL